MTRIDLPVRYHRLHPGDSPLGHATKQLAIDTERAALLLIDVYHAAAAQQAEHLVNHAWDQEWQHLVDERLAPVLRSCREAGLPVVYAMNSSPNVSMERSAFGQRLGESLGFDPRVDFAQPQVDPREYAQGEPVQLVIPAPLAPAEHDYYVRKHTYSGFFETRLDSVLRNLGVQTLLCAGFVLDCCVLFTVADAVFRNYRPVLLRDCSLAAELPGEIDAFSHTQRTTVSIESFLCPSATSADVIEMLT